MQVNESDSKGLSRELKVVIPASDVANRVAGRLAKLQQTARLPGFRPGKVPLNLLRQRFGSQVLGEALEEVVGESSTKVMEQRGLRPALRPRIKITQFSEGADLEYEMEIEVLPEIEPGDFAEIALNRPVVEIGDDQVDRALERLVERNRKYAAAPEGHASQDGDQIVIDFAGTIGGEVFAGGSGTDQAVKVGGGQLLPALDGALRDRKTGDAFAVDVTFPDDYPAENLRGKTAAFQVTVKDVRVAEALAADDKFAEALGLDSLAALREDLRKRLADDYGTFSRARVKRALLDALATRHRFDVPPGMVDVEFAAIWRQVEAERNRDAAAHDHTHDGHHHHHDHDHGHAHDHGHDHPAPAAADAETAKLKAEYRDIAERRVRLGLLLAEVGRRNSIDVTPEEINRAIITRARQFPGQEQKVFEFYTKNPNAIHELRAPLFEDKVVDHILGLAKITDKVVTTDELLRDPDEDAAEAKADQ